MKKCKNMFNRMKFSHFSDNLCVFVTQGLSVNHLVEAINRRVAGSIPDSVIKIFH